MNHEHVFERAALRHADGTPIPGGRRCRCGLEVVGDGLLAIDAGLVRFGHDFNKALAKGLQEIGARLEADRRRRFP